MFENNCKQVLVTEYRYFYYYLMKKIKRTPQSMCMFFDEIGVNPHMYEDNVKETNGICEWKWVMMDEGSIKTSWTEKHKAQKMTQKGWLKSPKSTRYA